MLYTCLFIAGGMHAMLAVLNLFLPRWLRWREEMGGVSLLNRQVVQVHAWFLALTLAIFALMTWRWADVMVRERSGAADWLAGSIAVFWTVRVGIQQFYYSPDLWRGRPGRIAVHIALFVAYGFLAVVYGWAAWGSGAAADFVAVANP